MSEYPWNEKNNTFTWLISLYNPFNKALSALARKSRMAIIVDDLFQDLLSCLE